MSEDVDGVARFTVGASSGSGPLAGWSAWPGHVESIVCVDSSSPCVGELPFVYEPYYRDLIVNGIVPIVVKVNGCSRVRGPVSEYSHVGPLYSHRVGIFSFWWPAEIVASNY